MINLILLPGMDGTGKLFAPFIAALGEACKVIVVSYPGQEALGYRELESIATSFVPKDEAYVILGESFSGPIAVSLAANAGPQLKGLILCASFVKNPLPLLSVLSPLLGFAPVSALPPAALSPILFGAFTSAPLRAQLTQALEQVAPQALRARLQAVLAVDVSQQLRKIAVPVLYLQAKQDRLVPSSAGNLIKRLKPETHFRQIEAPHLVLQAVPDAGSKIVLEFIQKIT